MIFQRFEVHGRASEDTTKLILKIMTDRSKFGQSDSKSVYFSCVKIIVSVYSFDFNHNWSLFVVYA